MPGHKQNIAYIRNMNEELNLVRDLAVILISAGIFSIICKALKQPSILGYIVAGFIISPNLGLFGISSMETVHQWSEIGIIFLMFGLGLEFSFKKLLSVGSQAVTIAGSKFLGMFIIGFTLGQTLGWSGMECVFLAGLLSMSSTAVIIKSYDDMGLKREPYAQMVFGDLVVEDMFAILMMVLLSTMAVSHRFAGGEMLFNLAKLAFFLILWFLVGIYLIPTVLKKAKKYINDEILLIVSIGLCFGMVTLANLAGFSSALGAFVIGSILAETVESEHIEKLVVPIKDLFGAIFFISVGMMISPSVIAQHWALILLITVVVLFCDTLFVGIGVILAGGGLKNACYAGLSLAMLGEFGFIIAGVGVNLGVMREFIYPVIIAVSVVTILVSPYMLRLAPALHRLLLAKLPEAWLSKVEKPVRNGRSSEEEKNVWKLMIKAYVTRLVLYSVPTIAVIISSRSYLSPLMGKLMPLLGTGLHNFLMIVLTLLLVSPFLYGLSVSSGNINRLSRRLLEEKESNMYPILAMILFRIILGVSFVTIIVESYMNLEGWAFVALIVAALLIFVVLKYFFSYYAGLEAKFLANFNEKEELQKKNAPVTTTIKRELGSYNVHIEQITLSADSSFAGKRLSDLPIRAESGANIIKVIRGSRSFTIPAGDFVFYPGDIISAVGTDAQLGALRNMVKDSEEIPSDTAASAEFKVRKVLLKSDSPFTGKRLDELRLRDRKAMIVSVLREKEFITNPAPDFVFEEGDVVWVAGEKAQP